VVDIIAVLTGSANPSQYWRDMKRRIQGEGFLEHLSRCQSAKVVAADGKLRETDCADFMTMTALIQYLPVQYRREPATGGMGRDVCGVYSIRNGITQDEYIGSSINVTQRFVQHRALFRRGKRHANRLQDAWSTFSENAFSLIILEEVADLAQLTMVEQNYPDQRQPFCNDSRIATNLASYDPVSPSRIRQTPRMLYQANGGQEISALLRAVEPAIAYGVLAPGPSFALLLQADASGVSTLEGFGSYLGQLGE
jgi:hypothetical protein